MNKFISLILVLVSLNAAAQDTLMLKNGDRYPFKDLLSSCITEAKKNKAPVKAEIYCDCMIKLSAPYVTITELKTLIFAGKTDANMQLFEKLKAQAPKEFYDCAASSTTDDRTNWTKSRCDIFYKSCLNNLPKDTATANMFNGTKYCNCVLSKVKNKFTSAELLDAENNPQLVIIMNDCLEASLNK